MKKKNSIRIFYVFAFTVFFLCARPCTEIGLAQTLDKMELQERTGSLLEELNNLPSEFKTLNAIFTDQSEDNIKNHAEKFSRALEIIGKFKENLDDWEMLVKQNKNDKVYRAYVASVQLALYSIYSMPYEFLNFLKVYELYDEQTKRMVCREIYDKKIRRDAESKVYSEEAKGALWKSTSEIMNLTWDDMFSKWEINARAYLMRAEESIRKAIELDKYYDDARILEAQLKVLQGDYDEGLKLFDALKNEGVFKDKRSFFNGWRAFILSKTGNTTEMENHLKKASAFAEPFEMSEWASYYLRSIRLAKSEWIMLEPVEFTPPEEPKMTALKERMIAAAKDIRYILRSPLDDIPRNLQDADWAYIAVHDDVFFPLEKVKTEVNVLRYAKMIEQLYKAGEELDKVMEQWDKLAAANEKTSYYYLLNKCTCGIVLLEMAGDTIEILGNAKVSAMLKKRQKELKLNEDVDYYSKWRDWDALGDMLADDIKTASSVKGDGITAKILAFQYNAIFTDSSQAIEELKKINEQLKSMKKKKVKILSDDREVNTKAYVAAWMSYLELKNGDLIAAKKHLEEVKTGFNDWKKAQHTIYRIEEFYSDAK